MGLMKARTVNGIEPGWMRHRFNFPKSRKTGRCHVVRCVMIHDPLLFSHASLAVLPGLRYSV